MKDPRLKIKRREYLKKNIPLIIMALPTYIIMICFTYLPLFGSILAFKDFSYRDGIFGSRWIGLENFRYIFSSGEILTTIGNTVLYHITFNITITCFGLVLGVLLYYVTSKKLSNFLQQSIILPYLVSYVVIAYIVYIFLSSEYGLFNSALTSLGAKPIAWYNEPKYWPVILTIVNTWFGAGIKSVYYYASLMSIDQSLFEAADLDGATKRHHIFNIMLPSIAPTICIFLIMDLSAILNTPFALFYSVPMDSSALYKVTDVLSTYTYRGLQMGNIGTTTALGLFTGVVTAIMLFLVNGIVKKINPENSLI